MIRECSINGTEIGSENAAETLVSERMRGKHPGTHEALRQHIAITVNFRLTVPCHISAPVGRIKKKLEVID